MLDSAQRRQRQLHLLDLYGLLLTDHQRRILHHHAAVKCFDQGQHFARGRGARSTATVFVLGTDGVTRQAGTYVPPSS